MVHNADRPTGPPQADGIVVTPSHNPPRDGGFKYNPPHGGPADTDATSVIAARANELLADPSAIKRTAVRRRSPRDAATGSTTWARYCEDLVNALNLDAIRDAGVQIGADPMGGASVQYWGYIAEHLGIDLTVVNTKVDPQWAFMTLDTDGKIRMDCSSPNAMASLIGNKDAYDISTGNDADADRHGIVTPDCGPDEPQRLPGRGDPVPLRPPRRLARRRRHRQDPGLLLDDRPGGRRTSAARWSRCRSASSGSCPGCAPARSASAARSRRAPPSSPWTAAPGPPTRTASCSPCWPARSRRSPASRPSELYAELTAQHGAPAYARVDAPANREQKAKLAKLDPSAVTATELAGEPITAKLTRAPGNGAAIGGLKVTTESAWFAARPSGTEDVYKIYAESFRGATTWPRCRRRPERWSRRPWTVELDPP